MKNHKIKSTQKKNLYKVLWSYEDEVGADSGVLDLYATSHKEAEKLFYENNRKLIVNTKGNKLMFNVKGGFVVEAVLTEKEWKQEGCPTKV